MRRMGAVAGEFRVCGMRRDCICTVWHGAGRIIAQFSFFVLCVVSGRALRSPALPLNKQPTARTRSPPPSKSHEAHPHPSHLFLVLEAARPLLLLQSLPLETKPTSLDELTFTIAYLKTYVKAQLPDLVPPAVFAVLALAMLLGFLLWRPILLCFCTHDPKGGAKAIKLLTGRQARWLKAISVLCALGAVAGGAYGVSQYAPTLVDSGLTTLHSVEYFLGGALDAAFAAVASASTLQTAIGSLKAAMQGLPAALVPAAQPYYTELNNADNTLDTAMGSLSTSLVNIRSARWDPKP